MSRPLRRFVLAHVAAIALLYALALHVGQGLAMPPVPDRPHAAATGTATAAPSTRPEVAPATPPAPSVRQPSASPWGQDSPMRAVPDAPWRAGD